MEKQVAKALSPPQDTTLVERIKGTLIHMDICCLPTESYDGNRYVATYLLDEPAFSFVHLLPSKNSSLVAAATKEVINFIETQQDTTIKTIRSDGGGEYFNHELEEFLKEKGIAHQFSAPHTPQQNGAAERINKTLLEKVRPMLLNYNVDKSLWSEAFVYANFLRNVLPSRALGNSMSPWMAFHGTKPNLSHLRVFGAPAYAYVKPQHQGCL